MSFLLETYCSFLPEEIGSNYTTAKLQHKLENHYGDSMVVQTQRGQGKSNMIFSSSISVFEAVRAASRLKAELQFSEIETSFVKDSIPQEDQTLHDAATILRSKFGSLEFSNDYYPSASDVSISSASKFVPSSLIKFLAWLVDDNCFHMENNYEELSGDTVRKCIALADCVISLHKN